MTPHILLALGLAAAPLWDVIPDPAVEPPPATSAAVEASDLSESARPDLPVRTDAGLWRVLDRVDLPDRRAALVHPDPVSAEDGPVRRGLWSLVSATKDEGASKALPLAKNGHARTLPVDLGTWTGLQRGRSGLDGGLQLELTRYRIRPAAQVGADRVGAGLGWRLFLFPVTVGVNYVWDLGNGSRRRGIYFSLASW